MTNTLSSFRHTHERRRRRRRVAILIIVALVMAYLMRGQLANLASSVLHSAIRPIWEVGNFFEERITDLSVYLKSKQELAKENARLSSALILASAENVSRDLLRAENTLLKERLGRPTEYTLILARVLAAPSRSPYDTLVIDVGEEHGVLPGMKVFGDGDFAIGEITQNFRRSAIVTLYTSSGVTLPVTIGTSSVPAVAYGWGGGNLRITIPRGLEIAEGTLVEIPALAPEYVGVVIAKESVEGSSMEHLYLALPFNLYELKWVYVAVPQ